ncbi:MAG: hypothetical protein AAB295_10250, partial [Chloroflexota bacterium]
EFAQHYPASGWVEHDPSDLWSTVAGTARAVIEKAGLTAVEDARRDQRLGVHGRMHAVWILAHIGGDERRLILFDIARGLDPDPRVQAQAVRALADVLDPVLRDHRLSSRQCDTALAEQLAKIAAGDRTVRLEIAAALGRLNWRGTAQWAERHTPDDDPVLAHAVMQALRRSQNWPAILKLIDDTPRESVRAVALRALADQAVPEIVDGLMDRLRTEPDADRRRVYADLLTRVYCRPSPWTYWGYRPPPRPANTVEWERTPQIKHAVNSVLLDPDRAVRLATLRRMQREKIPTIPDTVEAWLADERDPECVAAILESLKAHRPTLVREMLRAVVRENEHAT